MVIRALGMPLLSLVALPCIGGVAVGRYQDPPDSAAAVAHQGQDVIAAALDEVVRTGKPDEFLAHFTPPFAISSVYSIAIDADHTIRTRRLASMPEHGGILLRGTKNGGALVVEHGAQGASRIRELRLGVHAGEFASDPECVDAPLGFTARFAASDAKSGAVALANEGATWLWKSSQLISLGEGVRDSRIYGASGLAMADDASRCATWSPSGVRVWDVAGDAPSLRLKLTDGEYWLVLLAAQSVLAVTDRTISIVDRESGKAVRCNREALDSGLCTGSVALNGRDYVLASSRGLRVASREGETLELEKVLDFDAEPFKDTKVLHVFELSAKTYILFDLFGNLFVVEQGRLVSTSRIK